MRKKLFTFLLALVTSVGLMNAAPDASGSCGDNVTYSFNGTTGEMVISGTGPMTVYTSGSSLLPWKDYKDAITSVVVEDGVTSVSQYSFGQCTNLTTVVIGNDVETIGQFAFNDCGTSFTSLTLGSSLKSVGMAAFLNAKGITTLTLPDGFETVGDYAFCRLEALQTLNIPSSVTSIGTYAFYRCYPLATINCAAVTPPSLGDDAFGDIANKSNIPLYVPSGSVAAYEAAAQWTDFDIHGYDPAPGGGSTPANVCGDGLTWELNGGVLTISYDGVGTGEMTDFGYEYDESPVNVAPWKENKSAITTVIVGDGVKSIGNYAFNDLGENFTAVTIANSVERIGVFAFTNAKWITEITLPSSLKTIDKQCFAANFGITSITIPSGVTSIGYQAFSYCTALTSLTCEATTPPTLASGVFNKIRSTTSSISSIPLYVPSASVTAYEAAAQWNAFDIRGYDPAPATPTVYNSGSVALSNLKVGDILMAGVTVTSEKADYKITLVANRLKFMNSVRSTDLTTQFSSINPVLGENAVILTSTPAMFYTPIDEDGNTGNAWEVTANEVGTKVTLAGITYSGTTPASSDEHITANEDPKNTGVYYSTFFDSANKYTLPAGVEAYVAEVSSNALNLTKIAGEGQTIPADNAVILKSSVDQFTLSISNAAPVSFTATNNLHGVDADTDIASVVSGTCYVLSGNSTDGVGFFVYKAPNQLQAHKAYIDLNGSGMAQAPKRMPFVFNGEQTATGVENVQGNVQSTKVIENGVLYIIRDGKTYNAMGQMVK